ncbi:MAG: TPM domain-containing protein [Duganella sp.]
MLALLVGALCGSAIAQDARPVPPLKSPVTDLSASLSPDQISRLDADLRAFEERKGSQIAVLIVPTTKPETIEQYAIRVAEQWKLGRKKVDDGAILLVAKDDRTVRIEVGYGLEGVLNDATSKRIIDDIVVPRFRNNDFDGGIAAGVAGMMKVIDGEALPGPERSRLRDAEAGLRQLLPLALIVAVVLGGALRAALGRVPGAAVTGGILGAIAWLLAGTAAIGLFAAVIGFLFTLVGGGRLAGLYLGQGRGGGGGGGGWGGGGGGFGGGGASGRW